MMAPLSNKRVRIPHQSCLFNTIYSTVGEDPNLQIKGHNLLEIYSTVGGSKLVFVYVLLSSYN